MINQSNDLSSISSLTVADLREWWESVFIQKVRQERDGQRAALIGRAQELGVDLPGGGWRSIGEIASRMVRENG